MAAVDFTDWAVPDLVLTLGGRTYRVPPPSVDRARQVIACVVRAEINLRLHPGPLPAELASILAEIDESPLGHVSLGVDVYDRLVADEHPPVTIDRVAYYALFHWARGKGRADAIAEALWAPRQESGDESGEARSARPSRSTSGRSTASASRTRKASTRTTASPQG